MRPMKRILAAFLTFSLFQRFPVLAQDFGHSGRVKGDGGGNTVLAMKDGSDSKSDGRVDNSGKNGNAALGKSHGNKPGPNRNNGVPQGLFNPQRSNNGNHN